LGLEEDLVGTELAPEGAADDGVVPGVEDDADLESASVWESQRPP